MDNFVLLMTPTATREFFPTPERSMNTLLTVVAIILTSALRIANME
jgi:hypothetical protein